MAGHQFFRNDFETSLTATITTASTALALTAAPSPVITLSEADDHFLLTLVDLNGNREVVRCVGISGLNVTIGVALGVASVDGRAQENTTAIPITHTDDHAIAMRTTRGTLEAIVSDIEGLEANITIATTEQAELGTDDIHPLSPAKGRVMLDGYAPIATQVIAEGGTNNVSRMTPLRTHQLASALWGDIIEQGTKCIFKQNTVPDGWTFKAEDNDRTFLGTSTLSTGGETGGTWIMSGVSVDGHQLTEAELPTISLKIHLGTNTGDVKYISRWATSQDLGWVSGYIEEFGGDQSHDHDVSADGNWRMAYVKVITCERN